MYTAVVCPATETVVGGVKMVSSVEDCGGGVDAGGPDFGREVYGAFRGGDGRTGCRGAIDCG